MAPTNGTTVVPTTAQQTAPPTTEIDRSCEADGEGNFGFPTAPVQETIAYRYQVESQCSEEVTADVLNTVILKEIEKAISDVLVPNLFFEEGECASFLPSAQTKFHVPSPPTKNDNAGGSVKEETEETEEQRKNAQNWALSFFDPTATVSYDTTADGTAVDDPDEHKRRLMILGRILQSDFRPEDLVGLTAAPEDFVARGRLESELLGSTVHAV